MTKRVIALATALMLLLTACNLPLPAPKPITEEAMLATATSLLTDALNVIFMYQGEIKTNDKVAPITSELGKRYYPVVGYKSLEELRTRSRLVFTEGFCTNVLDPWAQDPEKPRFIEQDGMLWETSQVGNMGWLVSLVPSAFEVVSLDEDECVISGFSQSLLGEVTRIDFLLLREGKEWRVDSYYDFNLTLPTYRGLTVHDYLTELAGGESGLYRVTITPPDRDPLEVEQRMIPPFEAVFAALEYDQDAVEQVDALPTAVTADTTDMELTIYSGDHTITGYPDGAIYITAPSGTITRLQLLYPGGINLLNELIKAAKWQMKDFQIK